MQMIKVKIREGTECGISLPRHFKAPPTNFNAETLQQLIDWSTVKLTEPLPTATMTTEQLEVCVAPPWWCPPTGSATVRAWRGLSEKCRSLV